MGLLDDAIREHLDLKRRRGADPAEVERAEREALGPVRRNPAPADIQATDESDFAADESGFPADESDFAADDSGFAYDQAAEEDWSHDSLHEPASGAAEAAYDEPAPAEPAPAEPAYPEPEARESAYQEREPAEPEPFPTAAPSSRPLTDMGGGETQEYNVEDYLAAEQEAEPAGDEDVLEETPDFLQDTPDHDRLWFEQRPPKDFDFDE
jgi:hypothetical protein